MGVVTDLVFPIDADTDGDIPINKKIEMEPMIMILLGLKLRQNIAVRILKECLWEIADWKVGNLLTTVGWLVCW